MKDEVEDFLRRVAQMRAQAEAQAKAQRQRPQQQPAQQQPTQQRPPQQSPAPRQQPPRPPRRPEPRRPQLEPIEAEVVTPELRQRDTVSRHVQEHLRGVSEIAEHTRQLGAEVDLADDKLEAHLHEVFDHQLGQLTKSEVATAASDRKPPPSETLTPTDILRLLRSPQSVRDALIMSEIFHRPEQNW